MKSFSSALLLLCLSTFAVENAEAAKCKTNSKCRSSKMCLKAKVWRCEPLTNRKPSPPSRDEDFGGTIPPWKAVPGESDQFGRPVTKDEFGVRRDADGFPVDIIKDDFGREWKRDGFGYVDENGFPKMFP